MVNPLMRIDDLCRLMHISRSTYYRMVKSGEIPPEALIRKPGRRPYVNYAVAFPDGYAVLKEMMRQ